MATSSSTYRPLLESSKATTIRSFKPFFFVISLFAIIASAFFFVPNLIKPTHFDLCHKALDPKSCLSFVSEVVSDGETERNGFVVLRRSLRKYVEQMEDAVKQIDEIKNRMNDRNEQAALADCVELMDVSMDRVADAAMALENRTLVSDADAQTWLSGVLTNHVTCLDALGLAGRSFMGRLLDDLISRARASLALLSAVSASDDEIFQSRKVILPSWMTIRDRKLLESSAKDIRADVVVAQDGSGNYRTVAEAIASAPEKSKKRFVIHVKKGTYKENVEVGKKKKNLMIVGDGMDSTTITGSLNVVDGSTTFRSATLAAVGDGFILQDIAIENTAGPEKHQAVALRVGADQSVINRCRLDAFQDTLYAHSLRQFYRDSYITGTVDYIFGNAAVVFQNSQLVARKPMKSQKNMVTAQGRIDPNQNTGTSIQNCQIIASPDLEPVKASFPTYLGRPWKEYSRTVVMQSRIGDHIDPAGWSEWSGDFALKTLYYGEYMNSGPGAGAGTGKRVNWPGFRVIRDRAEAMKFTVAQMIQGQEWLASTGVAFIEGL